MRISRIFGNSHQEEAELTRLREVERLKSGLGWSRLPVILSAPDVLVDVGAASGTIGLYESFPKASIIAFEPLTEHHDALNALKGQYDLTVHQMALGAAPGRLPLFCQC